MATELSGDPAFKEKANLQKRATELTQFEKSFKSKKFDFENRIKSSEIRIKTFEVQISLLKKSIQLIEKIPGDEKGEFIFFANVAGQTYSKVGEFVTVMISEAEHAKKYKSVALFLH